MTHQHQWDWSQLLDSNPPRVRCQTCGETERTDLARTGIQLDDDTIERIANRVADLLRLTPEQAAQWFAADQHTDA